MLRVEPPARGGGCDGVAAQYRDIQGIHGLDGTAVTVMAMVYGNLGKTSGTGVLFRSPAPRPAAASASLAEEFCTGDGCGGV